MVGFATVIYIVSGDVVEVESLFFQDFSIDLYLAYVLDHDFFQDDVVSMQDGIHEAGGLIGCDFCVVIVIGFTLNRAEYFIRSSFRFQN